MFVTLVIAACDANYSLIVITYVKKFCASAILYPIHIVHETLDGHSFYGINYVSGGGA